MRQVGNAQPKWKSLVRRLVGLGMWRGVSKPKVITALCIVSSPAELCVVAIHSIQINSRPMPYLQICLAMIRVLNEMHPFKNKIYELRYPETTVPLSTLTYFILKELKDAP